MNTFFKSVITYCVLFSLTISSGVTVFITPNYREARNHNNVPTIERTVLFADEFYVRNNHPSIEERDPQTKTDHLSLLNGSQYFDTIKCFEVLKSQSLISSIVPEYQLSSDLKSPPNGL